MFLYTFYSIFIRFDKLDFEGILKVARLSLITISATIGNDYCADPAKIAQWVWPFKLKFFMQLIEVVFLKLLKQFDIYRKITVNLQ